MVVSYLIHPRKWALKSSWEWERQKMNDCSPQNFIAFVFGSTSAGNIRKCRASWRNLKQNKCSHLLIHHIFIVSFRLFRSVLFLFCFCFAKYKWPEWWCLIFLCFGFLLAEKWKFLLLMFYCLLSFTLQIFISNTILSSSKPFGPASLHRTACYANLLVVLYSLFNFTRSPNQGKIEMKTWHDAVLGGWMTTFEPHLNVS